VCPVEITPNTSDVSSGKRYAVKGVFAVKIQGPVGIQLDKAILRVRRAKMIIENVRTFILILLLQLTIIELDNVIKGHGA
jgi:hypothetical protein